MTLDTVSINNDEHVSSEFQIHEKSFSMKNFAVDGKVTKLPSYNMSPWDLRIVGCRAWGNELDVTDLAGMDSQLLDYLQIGRNYPDFDDEGFRGIYGSILASPQEGVITPVLITPWKSFGVVASGRQRVMAVRCAYERLVSQVLNTEVQAVFRNDQRAFWYQRTKSGEWVGVAREVDTQHSIFVRLPCERGASQDILEALNHDLVQNKHKAMTTWDIADSIRRMADRLRGAGVQDDTPDMLEFFQKQALQQGWFTSEGDGRSIGDAEKARKVESLAHWTHEMKTLAIEKKISLSGLLQIDTLAGNVDKLNALKKTTGVVADIRKVKAESAGKVAPARQVNSWGKGKLGELNDKLSSKLNETSLQMSSEYLEGAATAVETLLAAICDKPWDGKQGFDTEVSDAREQALRNHIVQVFEEMGFHLTTVEEAEKKAQEKAAIDAQNEAKKTSRKGARMK